MKWPDPFRIDGRDYRPAGILHRTASSENMRYTCDGQPDFVLKISRFRSIFGWLLWPLLVYMSWREHRIHQLIEGIPGIPRQGPRHGLRGYSHEYVPGVTLETKPRGSKLPEGFFEELTRIVRAVHERGVFYADLDRKANIIVAEDGSPWLIDYQASMAFRGTGSWWGRITHRFFLRLKREDDYHLLKHRRCYGDALVEDERRLLDRSRQRRGWLRRIRLALRRLRTLLGLRRTRKANDSQNGMLMRDSQQDATL